MHYDTKRKAWKRVKRKKRFLLHGGFTIILGVFFFILNMVTDPFEMWFIYPMIPLTTLVAIHYLFAFGIPGVNFMTREWEEREFERQMDLLDDDYTPYKSGRYLDYTELTEEEILELRKIRKEGVGGYFDEDLV